MSVESNKNVESIPYMTVIIALSVIAGVLLIVAVIQLIMLLKQRTDNKRSCLIFSFCILCRNNERLCWRFYYIICLNNLHGCEQYCNNIIAKTPNAVRKQEHLQIGQ